MQSIKVDATGLYQIVSKGVTQYVWIVEGDVSIQKVESKDDIEDHMECKETDRD